jgi:hypothetical protein
MLRVELHRKRSSDKQSRSSRRQKCPDRRCSMSLYSDSTKESTARPSTEVRNNSVTYEIMFSTPESKRVLIGICRAYDVGSRGDGRIRSVQRFHLERKSLLVLIFRAFLPFEDRIFRPAIPESWCSLEASIFFVHFKMCELFRASEMKKIP